MADDPGNRQPSDRGRRQPGDPRSLERLDWCVAQIERELAELVDDLEKHFARRHEHEAAVRALGELRKSLRDLNKRVRADYPPRTEVQRDYLSREEYAKGGAARRDVWLKAPLVVIAALQLLITLLVLTGGGQ